MSDKYLIGLSRVYLGRPQQHSQQICLEQLRRHSVVARSVLLVPQALVQTLPHQQ